MYLQKLPHRYKGTDLPENRTPLSLFFWEAFTPVAPQYSAEGLGGTGDKNSIFINGKIKWKDDTVEMEYASNCKHDKCHVLAAVCCG
jgi:hypothetical protein